MELHGVAISAAGVIAGSDAFVTLDSSCSILNTYAALTNMGATIRSTGTQSTSVASHLISTGSGRSVLTRDESTGASYPTATAIDVLQNSQHVKTDECMFSGFWRGVRLEEATLVGDANEDFPADGGNNSIRATQWGLMAMVKSEIDFGTFVSVPAWESHNEIVLTSGTGYHAAVDGTSIIYARQCWWDPVDTSSTPPINILGNDVEYVARLTTDPIPFTGSGGASFVGATAFGKTTTSPPPVDVRGLVKQALAQRDPGRVRHLGGQFLQSSAAPTADFKLLRFLHRALRTADARGSVDSLLALCLSRTDVESKLLAADIISEDSLYSDALQVLNSYSFAGSTELTKRALVRKALLYPRAYRGGYRDGLLAIDSLRSMNDSTLLRFVGLYPLLYSRLSHAETSIIPKRAVTSFIDPSIPSTIDVWPNYPNPFRDVTSFTFKLGEDTHVRLAVYDAMGREVAVVTDADYSRGVHSAVLRSSGLPSGLYFYRLTTDQGVIQRKMLLMR